MTFNELFNKISLGDVLTYDEYYFDRYARKKQSCHIENAIVLNLIQPNEKLNRELLEQYYGEGLDDQDYLQLSQINALRIVLNLGLNEDNSVNIKIIQLNRDFYNMGLQVFKFMDIKLEQEPQYTYVDYQRQFGF